jgi:hypothetical protein
MANVKGGGSIRKSIKVGPDYPEQLYDVPWGAVEFDDHWSGDKTGKTLYSPNGLTTEPDIPVNEKGYNELWEGK